MAPVTSAPLKRKRLWTYDKMQAELPETNQPTELWNGEIITAPAPSPGHQNVVGNFWRKLDTFVSERALGKAYFSPVDVVLTPHRVVQPDVVFVAEARRGMVGDHIGGVPDLVVEVVSQSSWRRDRIEKKALYEQAGVPEYWLVDQDSRAIEVIVLVAGTYELHAKAIGEQTAPSRLLPGFEVAFTQLEC